MILCGWIFALRIFEQLAAFALRWKRLPSSVPDPKNFKD